ncbi:MAG: hypothetical protein R2710_23220 [Acidimicrobiales bacterium]
MTKPRSAVLALLATGGLLATSCVSSDARSNAALNDETAADSARTPAPFALLDDDAWKDVLERIESGHGCYEQGDEFADSEYIGMELDDAANHAESRGFDLVIIGRDNGPCGAITADLRRDRIVATVIEGAIHSVTFT